jgi:ElaA protein
MNWTLKTFNELTIDEFHDIVQLRINIFVVEQNCPYAELDGKDRKAYHFFGQDGDGRIIAYTRIFGPGDYYEQPAIGRVVVDHEHRGDGTGNALMKGTIENMRKLFGDVEIKIGAQKYLVEFYGKLGFTSTGEEYVEDGIPHVHMIRKPGLLQ